MLLAKGHKWELGLWILLTFLKQNMKYQADSAMVAKKSRGSQEAWSQGGNDDPSQQLLHCSSNPHPHQNVQPFWTSQVSFKRDEKKKGRERKKQTSWKTKVGGFFPTYCRQRKTGTTSRDCLLPFKTLKSVYRNSVREKKRTCFHYHLKLLVCAVTKGWLVFFLPTRTLQAHEAERGAGASYPLAPRKASLHCTGEPTQLPFLTGAEKSALEAEEDKLAQGNPSSWWKKSLQLWRPPHHTPILQRSQGPPKQGACPDSPQEVELASRFLRNSFV